MFFFVIVCVFNLIFQSSDTEIFQSSDTETNEKSNHATDCLLFFAQIRSLHTKTCIVMYFRISDVRNFKTFKHLWSNVSLKAFHFFKTKHSWRAPLIELKVFSGVSSGRHFCLDFMQSSFGLRFSCTIIRSTADSKDSVTRSIIELLFRSIRSNQQQRSTVSNRKTPDRSI